MSDPGVVDNLKQEAADWVIALHYESPSNANPASSAALHAQFTSWVRQSPDHLAAFMAADDQFCGLEGMDRARAIDIEALMHPLSTACGLASPEHSEGEAPLVRPARRFAVWTAIVLMLTAGAIVWKAYYDGNAFSTRLGEQRVVVLEDGSTMTLNTDSRARVDFSKHARRIHLSRGEALFAVEHDPNRPFYVMTPSAVVRAVGTQFDVYQHDEVTTTITVIEGVIRYGAAQSSSADALSIAIPHVRTPSNSTAEARVATPASFLAAGQQVQMTSGGVALASIKEASDAIAWRDRLLVFHAETLMNVAAEFNRYNAVKLRVLDSQSGQLRLSGTYALDRPQVVAQYLQLDPSLSVERRGQEWIVRKR